MGKGQRLKEEKKQQEPRVVATITIEMLANDQVSVKGPITNPIAVFDVLGKAMIQLAAFYARQQAEQRSRPPHPSPLILPGVLN